jgi:light-regulated signal transduction histidine kinase (bacteriophytochrome)
VLAGGVAHDFNNLLTGILGNASLAIESTPPNHQNRLRPEEVMRAAEHAADLTRQLLAYAGKGRFVLRILDLSGLVREISSLIQSSIPKHVQLSLHLAETLPRVEADPGQMQQIVMNLVINGAEAIGPEGGSVLVRTSAQSVDEHYAATMSSSGPGRLPPGSYVCLEVHDTGCGMSPETLARIFDPFFTTKFAGRGLGLSAVLGLQPPRPRHGVHGVVPRLCKPYRFTRCSVGSGPGEGTILIVDDEEIVRQAARHTLDRYGYQTLTAADGNLPRPPWGHRGGPARPHHARDER